MGFCFYILSFFIIFLFYEFFSVVAFKFLIVGRFITNIEASLDNGCFLRCLIHIGGSQFLCLSKDPTYPNY